MKYLSAFVIIFLTISSCKKDNNDDQPQVPDIIYMNQAAGSTWNYRETNASDGPTVTSDYLITATAKDTSIENKSYHVYSYSYGGSKYLNRTNSDYYEYDSLNGYLGKAIERLYLRSNLNINGTWSQASSVMIPNTAFSVNVKLNNQIIDKNDRTVNGTLYTGVIHVRSTITSTDIPANNLQSAIDSYFAPKVGLIENSTLIDLDYLGIKSHIDVKTILTSSVLK